MTPEEQLAQIVKEERDKDLVPFFKTLDEKQRKNLVPYIQQLVKLYSEYLQVVSENGFTTYTNKTTTKQYNILGLAGFVCMNRKEFEKLMPGSAVVSKHIISPVLEWYCPSWFSGYINSIGKGGNRVAFRLNYWWLMELIEKGLVDPQPEVIAILLPDSIFNHGGQFLFKPDVVLIYGQTLTEHIWYLFQYSTAANFVRPYSQNNNGEPEVEAGWTTVFKKYSTNGLINRQRLLQETMLATTRNFGKRLSVWFSALLLHLEPTTKELLDLQKDLFNMFNSPDGKVISTALQCCRKIAEANEFDVQIFLDYTPLLLTSDSKALVSSTLQLLEKLAKKHADKIELITELACQALIHKEEDIRTKAARLIQKFGDETSSSLHQTVVAYHDTLFANAKSILQAYTSTTITATHGEAEPQPVVTGRTTIQEIHNTDELIFLASQAFDNNEPVHIDQLPAALIRLQHEIRHDNIPRLEPALQRAYKMLISGGRSTTGFLDHLLARFFIDYTRWLVREYPRESESIAAIQTAFTMEEDTRVNAWQTYDSRNVSRLGTLQGWKMHGESTLYDTHRHLLQTALYKLETKNTLPLLSTATHYPSWINACTLIDRLHIYQQQGVQPDAIDFQVALSRCDLQEPAPALQYAKEHLTGQYLRVICFLLDKEANPVGPFTDEFLWMTAALTRKQHTVLYGEFDHFYYKKLSPELLTGQYRWSSFVEDYFENKTVYLDGKLKTEKVPATREILDVQLPRKIENTPVNFLTKLFSSKKEIQPLIYEWLTIKKTFFSSESNDIKRLLSLIPNNPEPLLAQVVHQCLRHSVMQGEGDKKMVIAALEILLEIWKEPGEMAHLFVATCMICSDKTAASFAAEIWINGIHTGTIDSSLLGTIIGKHERIELAPLKRFTDLVMNRMFRVSPQHNRELEKMLTACLKELPEKPITNLKKLLEIYLELLSVNRTAIHDQELIAKASRWSAIPSLSKLVKNLNVYL